MRAINCNFPELNAVLLTLYHSKDTKIIHSPEWELNSHPYCEYGLAFLVVYNI